MNDTCRVLGCGDDPAHALFRDVVSKQAKDEYERHCRACNKRSLRAQSQQLRIRASAAM